jgi:hypothetical protein
MRSTGLILGPWAGMPFLGSWVGRTTPHCRWEVLDLCLRDASGSIVIPKSAGLPACTKVGMLPNTSLSGQDCSWTMGWEGISLSYSVTSWSTILDDMPVSGAQADMSICGSLDKHDTPKSCLRGAGTEVKSHFSMLWDWVQQTCLQGQQWAYLRYSLCTIRTVARLQLPVHRTLPSGSTSRIKFSRPVIQGMSEHDFLGPLPDIVAGLRPNRTVADFTGDRAVSRSVSKNLVSKPATGIVLPS